MGVLALLALVAVYVLNVAPHLPSNRLLLAPMVGGLSPCLHGEPAPTFLAHDPAFARCQGPQGSAAPLLEATLAALDPVTEAHQPFDLGYTLYAPLLKFLVPRGDTWQVDDVAIARLVNTIAQQPRRLVLYLFSTHFSSGAAIEPVLAADPRNMAVLPTGVMHEDKYYGMPLYPWSIARLDNGITARRIQVIEAISRALCAQPQAVRDRLAGITLLGETHHHFPSFEGGMGFDGAYVVSDYSDASVAGFQADLARRFGNVQAMNRALGGAPFTRFADVQPPAKDIRKDRLQHFWEHLDGFAAGRLPISGWLAPNPQLTGWVRIYLNGALLARVNASLGRQDVLFHKPELGTADVGWRYDLDYRHLPYGVYQVTVMAEAVQGQAWLMDNRSISLMRPDQSAPPVLPSQPLPGHAIGRAWRGHVDQPQPGAAYFFNPLAALWQDFRGQQVVRYLQYMERPLQASCLAPVPRYVHQLIPFPNPGWDDSKYAVEPSLEAAGDLQLGVSLYGEAGYGRSFLQWKEDHRRGGYGVTEFHPLRGMEAGELRRTLQAHQDHGARFVSFFMEGRGEQAAPDARQVQNFLAFDPANADRGSNQLYRSVQQLLAAP